MISHLVKVIKICIILSTNKTIQISGALFAQRTKYGGEKLLNKGKVVIWYNYISNQAVSCCNNYLIFSQAPSTHNIPTWLFTNFFYFYYYLIYY